MFLFLKKNLKSLLSQNKFILFGGKGGVGKTSISSASAIWAAEHGRKTLIISTDPAHSLGDSLDQKLPKGETVQVENVSNLYALEINPKINLDEYQSAMNVNPLESMPFGNSLPFMEDIGSFASMNPPGIDEAMAFGKVLEFIETESDYDLVIFDTAPTGHTLRLLALPDLLSGWIGKLISLRMKLGKIFGMFKKMFSKTEVEGEDPFEMFKKLKNSIVNARDELKDPSKTSFVIVMISEAMALYETERLLSGLYQYEIPFSNIIVNQIFPESIDCKFCQSRRNMQLKNLKEIRYLYEDDFNLIEIPLFDTEIRGYEQLKKLGKYLFQ